MKLLALTRKALVESVQPKVSYEIDVAALQEDVADIDGNLSVATSKVYVRATVTEAIDDLDELANLTSARTS